MSDPQISLKQLLARPETQLLFHQILETLGGIAAVLSCERELLAGTLPEPGTMLQEYPLEFRQQALGWIVSDRPSELVSSLLGYLLNQELEREQLAQQTLERYKEISLLYRLSEQLTANLDLKSIAALVLEEARKLIKATSGSILLVNHATQTLEILAVFGRDFDPAAPRKVGVGISGIVAETGIGELINDLSVDPRFVPGSLKLSSLIVVPLKVKDRVMGVMNFGSEEPAHYSLSDLKLLSALGCQGATAIENALLHESKLKEERIKSHLERYVPRQVAQAVLDINNELSLSPVRRKVTILFSDIRNFTSQCEELSPEAIVSYLNTYFTEMVNVIFAHQGTVNKFVGDMIVALFGAPSQLIDSEKKAIEAAIAMQRQIQQISEPWIRHHFDTGIGISAGEAVVGNIGSTQHMDYTAIGDEVNVAARLQSLAKGGQILVNRQVYDATRSWFEFREIGLTHVKGRRKAIEVFEVVYSL